MTQQSLQAKNGLQRDERLRWQSQLVLLVTVPPIAAAVLFSSAILIKTHDPEIYPALGISAAFALLVWLFRAATAPAALTGGLIAASLYCETPGLHTALWPLGAMLALTLLATRTGHRHKERLGTAESKHGRSASQVAANLGVAALTFLPLILTGESRAIPLVVLTAALAEAAADTLASELGQVLGGAPRMITTWKRVPAGTDGAITVAGTLAGCAGAAIVAAVAGWALRLSAGAAGIAFLTGVFGLFFDSLIGATVERRGWLNNDAVNFLSTLAAAMAAYGLTFV